MRLLPILILFSVIYYSHGQRSEPLQDSPTYAKLTTTDFRGPDNLKALQISYKRPNSRNENRTNDREDDILHDELSYGEVWGKEESNPIYLDLFRPIRIAHVDLAPGRYRIFVVPGKNRWEFVLTERLRGAVQNLGMVEPIVKLTTDAYTERNRQEALRIMIVDSGGYPAMVFRWKDSTCNVPFEIMEVDSPEKDTLRQERIRQR